MSKRSEARSRLLAKTAYKLRRKGLTNQQIADQLGIDVKVVPARVDLGERLADAEK